MLACKKCGSLNVFIKEKGGQNLVYCGEGCGFIKCASNSDMVYMERQGRDNNGILTRNATTRKAIKNNSINENNSVYGLSTLQDAIKHQEKMNEVVNTAYNRGLLDGLKTALSIMGGNK